MATMQYKLRLEEATVKRLTALAVRLGYPSGNAFAADCLEKYADTLAGLIEDLKTREADALREQQEQVSGKASAPAKPQRARKAS